MSLLAVIPARLGATRLPRKPLRLLGGAPLVVRVWQRAQELGVASSCVVATDSAEIREAVIAAGGDAVLTRSDHPTGTDRVAEVAALPRFADVERVLNIQGDEPFASAEALGAAISALDAGHEIGTVACAAPPEVLLQPDVVKVVSTDRGRALYFSRAPIPFLREPDAVVDRAERDCLVRRHIGIYAYTRDALARWVSLPVHPLERVERLEQLRPLAHGLSIGVSEVAHPPLPGIDTEDDLARADAAWPAWRAEQHRIRPLHLGGA